MDFFLLSSFVAQTFAHGSAAKAAIPPTFQFHCSVTMKSGVVSPQEAVASLELKTPIGSPKRSGEGMSPPSGTLPTVDIATETAAALSKMLAKVHDLEKELMTERAARRQLQHSFTLWEQHFQSDQEPRRMPHLDEDEEAEEEPQRQPEYFQTHSPAGGEEEWSD